MVQFSEIEEQLNKINSNYKFFGRPEIKELAKIIMPGETITQCVNGRYEGGFALLCVTDRRLLLIDKKPMFLTLEDVRFDMIAEINFSHRLLNATVRVHSTTKSLIFTSWNTSKLRELVSCLQQHVMEMRFGAQQAMASPIQFQFIAPSQQGQPPRFIEAESVVTPVPQQYAPQPQQPRSRISAFGRQVGRIAPSLAHVAFRGSSQDPATQPNPYQTQPDLARRRLYPFF